MKNASPALRLGESVLVPKYVERDILKPIKRCFE
jgi:hypothetical protein